MLKAILFNLDGIITNLSTYNYLSWKSVFSHYDVNLDEDLWNEIKDHSRTTIAKLVLEKNNIEYDNLIIDKICNEKNELYKSLIANELSPTNVFPNILNIITEAKAKDLKVCVISHSKNAKIAIERLGLSKAFDFVCLPKENDNDGITSLIGASPISNSIAEFLKISGINGGECIGIESTEEGILEFNLFNIFSVYVSNYSHEKSLKAKMVFPSVVDLNLNEIIFQYYTVNPNE